MKISVIASGSNGNCCLIEEKGTSVLVDAGKSGREIARRMGLLGKSIEDVNAVLITVYMTKKTSDECILGAAEGKTFDAKKEFNIGKLRIKPIKTSHNVSSCGFMFNSKFALLTDTGCVTRQMEDVIKKVKAVLLESNHDIDMLIRGPYPYFLKQWILGNEGHLSNIDASNLIQEHAKNLSLAILGHLSGNNNTPERALKTFDTLVRKKIEVRIASRDDATGNFEV